MLQDNATVGHCVVCGTYAPRQLCRRCQRQYTGDDGKLLPAVRALQRIQMRQAERERRNRERLRRGVPQQQYGPGQSECYGVEFVPLYYADN